MTSDKEPFDGMIRGMGGKIPRAGEGTKGEKVELNNEIYCKEAVYTWFRKGVK